MKKTEGTVIAAHGRHYRVELADRRVLSCFPRGQKSDVACGDRVIVSPAGDSQGVIDEVLSRKTLLYRSDEFRRKLIAANATQIIIVVATEPSFSDELVTRCLVAAENQEIRALIALNKCDLPAQSAQAALAPFSRIGYPVLSLCAKTDVAPLRPWLAGQTTVLVGQSGMGKSTIINALIPEANARTREISGALDTGKHTTTHATLYRLDAVSAVIDSPGLQEFGLSHLSRGEIEHGFREFRPFAGQCRFRDCRHDVEPGCAIHAAVNAGLIDAARYAAFRTLCRDATR